MRVLYAHHLRNTFTRIDRDLLAERYEVEDYFQPGPPPRPLELVRGLRRCDVVFGWFAHWHTLAALNLAWPLGVPSVLVIGGFDTAAVPEIGYGNQLAIVRKARSRLAIRRATRLITNSHFSQREIGETLGLGPERVRVVHHGLPDRFGDVDPAAPREPLVLTVAGVDRTTLRRKGLDAFVRAAAQLPDVEFALVGRWLDDAIEQLRADAPPNVRFTGWVADDELDRWLRRAAVYVQASVHEGFGLSLAEAMQAAAVPVTTAAGALPEVVGDVGVRIDDASADAVASGVRAALELGPDARARARARILDRFPLSARREGIHSEVEAAARGERSG